MDPHEDQNRRSREDAELEQPDDHLAGVVSRRRRNKRRVAGVAPGAHSPEELELEVPRTNCQHRYYYLGVEESCSPAAQPRRVLEPRGGPWESRLGQRRGPARPSFQLGPPGFFLTDVVFGPVRSDVAGRHQVEKCSDVVRAFVGAHMQRRVDGGQQARTVDAVGGSSRRHQPILQGTVGGVRGTVAGHAAVQHGAEGVDVRCWPLIAHRRGVLFERSVAGGDHRSQAPRLGAGFMPGGTEVDQDRHTVGADHDVAGLDVPVQQASPVDLVQTRRDRQHVLTNLRFSESGFAFQQFRQRLTVNVLHHDIAGTVRLDETFDADDVRMIETRQRAGFVKEPVETPPEIVFVLGRDKGDASLSVAHCEPFGQILLDRHAPVQVLVDGCVGDAEPPGTQIPLDAVLTEPKARRQGDEIPGV